MEFAREKEPTTVIIGIHNINSITRHISAPSHQDGGVLEGVGVSDRVNEANLLGFRAVESFA